ncbi:MAG: 50S ribosomal protein L24 [Candidatus Micrarchaeia archaeon]
MVIRASKCKKQRKYLVVSPLHKKQDMVSAHVSKELRKTVGKRSLRVKKGYVVKVMRGEMKGREGKVTSVYLKNRKVAIEGLMAKKMDGKEKPLLVDPSNLMITKLEVEAPKASTK